MNPNWTAGEAIKAKETVMNRRCGIRSDQGWGHVCFVDQRDISFYLQRDVFGGQIEARYDLATFVMNFDRERFRPLNAGYSKATHFTRKFPTDFSLCM
jgi:hypothetical protein